MPRPLIPFLLMTLVFAFPAVGFAQSKWVDLFAAQEDEGCFANWNRLGKQQGEKEIAKNWQVTEDGWLHLYKPGGHGSSLILKEEIGDFELSFFWKIKSNANNGIKFRVRDYEGKTLGIEYQLLDDEMKDGKTPPKHRTGSLYALVEPAESKTLNAPETLNHSRIVVKDNVVEHWLNGVQIASAVIGSKEWKAAVKASKFAPHAGFGENQTGRIMFTDHGGEIWFRDVLLRKR